jgi:crotonobetainyl-CoA:carnitine CoA-transferase CaiB-like acyl-CoA transferase
MKFGKNKQHGVKPAKWEGSMPRDLFSGILSGLTVLEIGHFVAAPFCTRLLADLGADIIKIEPPGGDPVRQSQGSPHFI